MTVAGAFKFGDDDIVFKKENSFGSMDWTRSFAARETIWKWACLAGLSSSNEKAKGQGKGNQILLSLVFMD